MLPATDFAHLQWQLSMVGRARLCTRVPACALGAAHHPTAGKSARWPMQRSVIQRTTSAARRPQT